jgi:hypothetical protein
VYFVPDSRVFNQSPPTRDKVVGVFVRFNAFQQICRRIRAANLFQERLNPVAYRHQVIAR